MEREGAFGKVVVVVLALAVLATLVDAAAWRRRPEPEPRLLSVSAEAYEEAEPDVVRISLGIKAVRPTPKQAAAAVAQTVGAVKMKLAALGVGNEAVETSELYLGEATTYDYTRRREVRVGYKAYYWLRVTLKHDSFPRLAQVIDAAVAGGATSLSRLTWEIENDNALRAKALETATTRARQKAQAMARAAGTRIAGIYKISEQYGSHFALAGPAAPGEAGAEAGPAPGAPPAPPA